MPRLIYVPNRRAYQMTPFRFWPHRRTVVRVKPIPTYLQGIRLREWEQATGERGLTRTCPLSSRHQLEFCFLFLENPSHLRELRHQRFHYLWGPIDSPVKGWSGGYSSANV